MFMQSESRVGLPWDNPSELWSLADMIQHFCVRLCSAYGELLKFIEAIRLHPSGDVDVGADLKTMVAGVITHLIKEVDELHLNPELSLRVRKLQMELVSNRRFTSDLLLAALQEVRQDFTVGLAQRKFAYIETTHEVYFQNEKLFGEKVYESFPEARDDLKDAGTAFSASLYTAAVFHLMRVTEHGLRKLARHLLVSLTHTGARCPIEFADWDKVITQIRNKTSETRKLPAGPKKQAKLEMYSNAADHCEYMKDIFRNNVSHTRKAYNEPEALGVMKRVEHFMLFLADGLRQRR
jgi:hypothetical protein